MIKYLVQNSQRLVKVFKNSIQIISNISANRNNNLQRLQFMKKFDVLKISFVENARASHLNSPLQVSFLVITVYESRVLKILAYILFRSLHLASRIF